MLSFFPQDVLDEIWTQMSQFPRVFLPTLLKGVKKVRRHNLNIH